MSKTYNIEYGAGLRTRLLAASASLAIAAVCLTTPAIAQDAAPAATPDDETVVVVSGIRKGIQDAITAKRKDSSIIEAVSAEDIGKLPDNSIAESIGRLPGIAAQRDKGRAQTLSIRGLGPDFTVTTLNGREQASTNDNRSVEYDQYPSEVISQVKVYKTPNAGMSYQGIAGTVDLETVRQLSYGKRALSLNYKIEQNSTDASIPGAITKGDRYNITYIDQFADKTVGLALGVAHTKAPYQAETHEPWGYPEYTDGNLVIGGDKSGQQSSYYDRTSFFGALEFKPNDQLHVTIDAFHSDFTEMQTIRRLEYGTVWGTGQVLSPGYTVKDGRITSGTFNGVTTVIENYNNERHARIDNFGVNIAYQLNDDWSLLADLSDSKVHRTDLRLESTAGTGPAGAVIKDNFSFTTDPDGFTNVHTELDYSDFSKVFLTDPGGWGGPNTRAGYVGNPTVDDEIKAVRLAATRKFHGGPFSDLAFGVNYADRSKSKYQWQGMLINRDGPAMIVPEAYRTGTVNTDFLGNSHGMLSYDAMGLYKSGFWSVTDARVDPLALPNDRIFDITQTWSMDEKLTTAFVRADIDTHLFGLPLTGNIGVQSQTADQSVIEGFTDGTLDSAGKIRVSTVNDGDKYTDILPSMNLNFALADDMSLRFAAASTVARPPMDYMAGGTSFTVAADGQVPYGTSDNPYYWNASGGNAHLKPWKANAYDISFEKYFGRKGYISAAVYYKQLTSYIYYKVLPQSFAGVDLPPATGATTYANADANRNGYTGAQTNGEGGHVQGFEVTASIPGELLTPVLDGFGVVISGAYNESEIAPTGVAIPLPGLSPRVINATVYYEKHGFSARVSGRYRGAWLGQVPNFDSSLGSQWIASEKVVDAQIGYTFDEGNLKGWSVNLSGYNLTDQPFVIYAGKGQTQNIIKYENYGADYMLSIGYKFF
jgi:iron complex outermembrane receptor protein